MLNDPDCARRAFDAVASAQTATTFQELDAAVAQELRALGYEACIGARIVRRGGVREVNMLFGDVDHPSAIHYRARGHAAFCPVAGAASPAPTFWSEVRERPMSARERLVLDELADFRLHEGHIVVVDRGQDGSVAVSIGGEHVEVRDPYVRAATHLLSVHFGLVGMKLWRQAAEGATEAPMLSARQIECLKWVRDGKSSVDISEILGISARTVDEHIERACRRLAVKTRVQAVAEAALQGLLEL